MALTRITDQERETLRQKSAQSLPDVPSLQNWTPKQFKNAITKVLFDNSNSFYAAYNRLVDELTQQYLTKEDEKVFRFEETFADVHKFASKCLDIYETGKTKLFYGSTNEHDLLGIVKANQAVLIIGGDGFISYSNGQISKQIVMDMLKLQDADIDRIISNTAEIKQVVVKQHLNASNATITIAEPNQSNHPATRAYVDNFQETLSERIEGIEAAQNLLDIVANKATLNSYNTSLLKENDKIKVLEDETMSGVGTYYKWNGSSWEYIGKDGMYYTQTEVNNRINILQAQIDSLKALVTTLTASNVSYKED